MTESTAAPRTRDAIRAGHSARADAFAGLLDTLLPWRATRRD